MRAPRERLGRGRFRGNGTGGWMVHSFLGRSARWARCRNGKYCLLWTHSSSSVDRSLKKYCAVLMVFPSCFSLRRAVTGAPLSSCIGNQAKKSNSRIQLSTGENAMHAWYASKVNGVFITMMNAISWADWGRGRGSSMCKARWIAAWAPSFTKWAISCRGVRCFQPGRPPVDGRAMW
jgi:hypothetical protein